MICCVAGAATLALLVAASTTASAQGTQRTNTSAFDTYRPWQPDAASADWRAANNAVQTLGGHAGQLRGSAPAEATTSPQKEHSGQHSTHGPEHKHKHMHSGPMQGGTMHQHGQRQHHSHGATKPAEQHQHTEPRK